MIFDFKHYEQLTKVQKSDYDKLFARSMLDSIKQGDTIHCIVRTVAKSGMSRRITLLHVVDGQIQDISHHVANLLDWSLVNGAIKVDGCGMDMCFHTVYTLAKVLFSNVETVEDRGYWLECHTI